MRGLLDDVCQALLQSHSISGSELWMWEQSGQKHSKECLALLIGLVTGKSKFTVLHKIDLLLL